MLKLWGEVDLNILSALAEDVSLKYINTQKQKGEESKMNTKEMSITCIFICSKYECEFTFGLPHQATVQHQHRALCA